MFLTSALEIMLQLYKEYCSVLKEKWRDHDLCLGLFLSSVGFVFVFVFLSFHPYTQCPSSAPPPPINTDMCVCLRWGKCVAVGRSELLIVLSLAGQVTCITKPQNNHTMYSTVSVGTRSVWGAEKQERKQT